MVWQVLADALAFEDPLADLHHFFHRHGFVELDDLRRPHLLLRNGLTDHGVDGRQADGQENQLQDDRDALHDAITASEGPSSVAASPWFFLPERLESQKMNPIKAKKIRTVTETTLVAKPRVGVKASTEVSRMTP